MRQDGHVQIERAEDLHRPLLPPKVPQVRELQSEGRARVVVAYDGESLPRRPTCTPVLDPRGKLLYANEVLIVVLVLPGCQLRVALQVIVVVPQCTVQVPRSRRFCYTGTG